MTYEKRHQQAISTLRAQERARFDAMRPWDGVAGEYQYPKIALQYWDMRIDKEGNIWYLSHDEHPSPRFWCTAKELPSHVRELCELCKYTSTGEYVLPGE